MKSLKTVNALCFFIFVVVSCSKAEFVMGDTIKPTIGQMMPDFSLNHITNYNLKSASLADFRGKWLIMDFWFTKCTTCIKSFPKINALQDEFKNDVLFLLIGLNDHQYNKGIEKLFEKIRAKQNINLASAYDSILISRWGITSMPHILIIDPSGVLKYISDGRDLTREKLRDLIKGKKVVFYSTNGSDSQNNNQKLRKRFLLDNTNVLYRSLLTKWNGEVQNSGFEIDKYTASPQESWKDGWSVSMIPLYALYNYAYIGRWSWSWDDELYGNVFNFPILELKDSSLFAYDFKTNVGAGTFNYNITLPIKDISKENIMTSLQNDLKKVFKYDVSIEKRTMPIWKLISLKGARNNLKTTGGPTYTSEGDSRSGYNSIAAGFTVKNFPMRKFLAMIGFYLPNDRQLAFIDETGIDDNIDITIDADLTNYQSLRAALRKNSLDLIIASKEMSVIVIRDSAQVE
jgi:thiol-disulfide isomerase/thioredoxin